MATAKTEYSIPTSRAPELHHAEQLVIAAARRWRNAEAGASVDGACDDLADAVDALDRAEAVVPTTERQ